MVEDLSWVKNPIGRGRWNRGEFVKWLAHYVELNGSRVMDVRATDTSQECCHCHTQVVHIDSRTVRCPCCGRIMDRDLNAAVNIAQRGEKKLAKAVKTRKGNKHFTEKIVRRSPQTHSSLKHPGVKPGSKIKKIKGVDRTKNKATVHHKRKTVAMKPYDDVVGKKVTHSGCSPIHTDDGARVIGDDKLRTLKRQHDIMTYKPLHDHIGV